MMLKKGVSLPMNILVVCIILLVVLVVYLGVFQGLFRKEGGQIDCQINRLGDDDEDGVINMFDKCCPAEMKTDKVVGADGCAEGQDHKICKCT